jgi:hypothetical protein
MVNVRLEFGQLFVKHRNLELLVGSPGPDFGDTTLTQTMANFIEVRP